MENTILVTHDDITELPTILHQINETMFIALSSGLLGIMTKFETNIVFSGNTNTVETDHGIILASDNAWKQAIDKFSKALLELVVPYEYTWFHSASIDNRLCLCAFTALLKSTNEESTFESPYRMFDVDTDVHELNEAISEIFYAN
ncbi:hypothetical protein LMH73_009805 [Vibrio splendidus]|nr:hypothetical protein [Vibrio splendidus]MCC4883032.1 hypothetical protein [Vibrio splendidus]